MDGACAMNPTNNNDRELNKAELGQNNELLDEELAGAAGGLSITKQIDSSSPKLFQTCCNGTHYKSTSA
jgi:type VI protein secretion system component Hcp